MTAQTVQQQENADMLRRALNAPTEFRVTVTVHNAGPHTIWAKLAAKLGREPTTTEAAAEVRRIILSGAPS